jgi:hypothetical protein
MGDRAVYWQLPVDAHVGFFVGVDFLDFKNSGCQSGVDRCWHDGAWRCVQAERSTWRVRNASNEADISW